MAVGGTSRRECDDCRCRHLTERQCPCSQCTRIDYPAPSSSDLHCTTPQGARVLHAGNHNGTGGLGAATKSHQHVQMAKRQGSDRVAQWPIGPKSHWRRRCSRVRREDNECNWAIGLHPCPGHAPCTMGHGSTPSWSTVMVAGRLTLASVSVAVLYRTSGVQQHVTHDVLGTLRKLL
jgi:hypothetical protein